MTAVTAVIGDVHGHHHRMVSMVQSIANKKKVTVTSVLQVGDFEAHRHTQDVSTMDAPQKYRKLGDFSAYYEGGMRFPWPVYFIGGNHEPYGWYEQHLTGAELTENCYYFGRVGQVKVGRYSVVGLSGIFHPQQFYRPRPSIDDIGSVSNRAYGYYTEHDVAQAMKYKECDILMLHDWPRGIIHDRDIPAIEKRFGAHQAEEIGNEFTLLLIEALKPKVVLCGHMHYKYQNTISIGENTIAVCCVANVVSGSDAVIFLDEQLNVID